MTPGKLREEILAERTAWIREMLAGIRSLPLDSPGAFKSNRHDAAAAESYLRRALEALLDLGRHVVSKGFGRAAAEYKEIADQLIDVGILTEADGHLLREMAGYRNRLVHFYDRVTGRELYEICTDRLTDVERILEAILAWIQAHPENVEGRKDTR